MTHFTVIGYYPDNDQPVLRTRTVHEVRQPTGEYYLEVVYEQGVPNKDRLATVLFGDE